MTQIQRAGALAPKTKNLSRNGFLDLFNQTMPVIVHASRSSIRNGSGLGRGGKKHAERGEEARRNERWSRSRENRRRFGAFTLDVMISVFLPTSRVHVLRSCSASAVYGLLIGLQVLTHLGATLYPSP